MSDYPIPELDDEVEYGVAVFNPDGSVKVPAPLLTYEDFVSETLTQYPRLRATRLYGIIGASKSAAIEYGTQGIRVNTICPGFILTEIMAVGAEDFIPDIAAKAALNRAGQPHEVAVVGAVLTIARLKDGIVRGVAFQVLHQTTRALAIVDHQPALIAFGALQSSRGGRSGSVLGLSDLSGQSWIGFVRGKWTETG